MPFLSFNQKDLHKVLGICNQVSSSKNPVEIFTYTKVESTEDGVNFSAINQEVFFKTSLKPITLEDNLEKTSFLIKTDIFYNAISLINDEIIGLEINLEKNTLITQGSKSKHTLRINTEDVTDFHEPAPKSEEVSAEVTLKTTELLKANKFSNVSVGNPKTVYQSEFLSICYTLRPTENRLILASTDRYRVSKNVLEAKYDYVNESFTEEKRNFLVPPKGLGLISNFSQEEVTLIFENTFLWIKSDKNILVLRYGDGQFPDYDKIIPQSFACTFSVNTKDLLDALRQAQFSARINSTSQSVSLKVKPSSKSITLSSKNNEGYASESSVDIINYEGVEDEWEQSFNIDYLLSYVSAVEADNILWEANPSKPSVLSPQNKKDVQLYLVSGLK